MIQKTDAGAYAERLPSQSWTLLDRVINGNNVQCVDDMANAALIKDRNLPWRKRNEVTLRHYEPATI